MNRRLFATKLAATGAIFPFLRLPQTAPTLQKPNALEKGDTVGLIAPGSPVEHKSLEKAVKNMENLKLKVKIGANVEAKRGYLAGTDQQRLDDLHAMFADDEVKAVWCIRGGYGCTRLLPHINFEIIRNNPKVFVGYSDITALHQAIYTTTGLVTFHGPGASSEFTRYVKNNVEEVLFKGKARIEIEIAKDNEKEAKKNSTYQTRVITEGTASGILAGGNLTLLAAMAGTPHGFDATDKLVFLEDVGEKPYRIDRILTQLLQAANLHLAKGILLGIFEDCEAGPKDLNTFTLQETLTDRLADLKIPVVYGLSFGHITEQCILPLGIQASINTATKVIQLQERPVKSA